MARQIRETSERGYREPARYTKIPRLGELDDWYQLHYQDGDSKTEVLRPGEIITDPDLEICIIGNRSLRPDHLLLRDSDREPIEILIPDKDETVIINQPGKSGMFLLHKSGLNGRQRMENAVLMALNRNPKRQDNGHVATVREINQAGWEIVWAPLQNKNLFNHVRLMPVDESGRYFEPTLKECEQLKAVLQSLRHQD